MTRSAGVAKVLLLAKMHVRANLLSSRNLMMIPFLALFILGACWGLADPEAVMPAGIPTDTPYEILNIAAGLILIPTTLGVVVTGFDGVSRRRASGVLEIELSQPIERDHLACAIMLGTWATIAIPTLILCGLGIILVNVQMGAWPSIAEASLFLSSVALLIFWYTAIQLLASSLAKDIGGSIAIGIGTWMVFTMLWLLISVFTAALMGVEFTDTTDSSYLKASTTIDMFSPNGVFGLILEFPLKEQTGRPISLLATGVATLFWTILPTWLFWRRFRRLR